MKNTPPLFQAEQFTPTRFDSAEAKAQWANAMARWVKAGFLEDDWRKGLYEPLRNMYGHIAHYNQHGFYCEWFMATSHRLNWLRYARRGGWIGLGIGDPAYTWSDVEQAFAAWITTEGLVERYQELERQEFESLERELLARLQAKYLEQLPQ